MNAPTPTRPVALLFNDPIETSRWVFEQDEMEDLRRDDPTRVVLVNYLDVIAVKLTETQRSELEHIYRSEPLSIHDHDRTPHMWVRFVSRRTTILAMARHGLIADGPYPDLQVGGYKALLTPRGYAVRAWLRYQHRPLYWAIRTLAADPGKEQTP